MPALPSVPKVIKVTLPFKLTTDPNALSRFFVQYSGTAPTPIQLQTFCDAVATSEATEFGPLMSGLYTMEPVTAEDLSSPSAAVASGTISNAGSRAGGAIAPGTALMIQFLIARRYRGGKPKIFLPLGVTTDITAGGVWAGAFLTSAGTGWAAFETAIAAAGWTGAGTLQQVNVSYYQGFTVVTNPVTHRSRNVPTLRGAPVVDPVFSIGVEQGLASQRRRNAV
jgi:hypothetical protein